MREKLQSKKGFTLAELLIVVAIIAVLMAIMVPVFGNSRAAAVLGKDAANLRSIYSEAVSTAMGDDSNYNAGVFYLKFQDYINEAKKNVKFDSTTKTDYIKATDSAPAKILIWSSKLGTKNDHGTTYEIALDNDMKILQSGHTASSTYELTQNKEGTAFSLT